MNILIVSPFRIYPIYSGFSTRVYNLTKQLSNSTSNSSSSSTSTSTFSSNSVFLFYIDYYKKYSAPDDCNFLPNVPKFCFKTSNKFMQLLHPYLILKGVSAIKKEKIDLVIAEGIWGGLHAMIFRAVTKVPYCLTEHNVEHVRWKRMGKKYPGLLRILEKYCCKYSKKVFCMSNDDRKQINELGVDLNKIITVPNGVNILQFWPEPSKKCEIANKLNISVESPLILFSGNLDYTPNLQAVQIIYEKIINPFLETVPDAKFLIVGSNPPLQFKHESIIFTGYVEKIEDYINASDLVIAPLISGGGTKLKIVEAIACGKTVITTSVGAEGLFDENTEGFLKVADNWNDFILKMIDSLKNPRSLDLPRGFIDTYSWNFIGDRLCKEIITD